MDSKKQNENKVYLTKEGLDTFQTEYDELTKVKRPAVLEQVTSARSLGDLSENAEYAAARDELSFIDGRIAELKELFKNVSLINDSKNNKTNHQVRLGSRVTLHVDGKKEVFTVVGEWEADPAEKKISHESPLGQALLGKRVGEKVQVEAPVGKIIYKIVDIG